MVGEEPVNDGVSASDPVYRAWRRFGPHARRPALALVVVVSAGLLAAWLGVVAGESLGVPTGGVYPWLSGAVGVTGAGAAAAVVWSRRPAARAARRALAEEVAALSVMDREELRFQRSHARAQRLTGLNAADLRAADLTPVPLSSRAGLPTDLSGADLTRADLRGVKGTSPEDIRRMSGKTTDAKF